MMGQQSHDHVICDLFRHGGKKKFRRPKNSVKEKNKMAGQNSPPNRLHITNSVFQPQQLTPRNSSPILATSQPQTSHKQMKIASRSPCWPAHGITCPSEPNRQPQTPRPSSPPPGSAPQHPQNQSPIRLPAGFRSIQAGPNRQRRELIRQAMPDRWSDENQQTAPKLK